MISSKKFLAVMMSAALCISQAVPAEEETEEESTQYEEFTEEAEELEPPFDTIGDAKNAEGYTGIAGSDEEHFIVVVEMDGEYIRLCADLDEEAIRLSDATLDSVDADSLEAAFEAYNAYIATLPISYAEKITAEPVSQEELDELAGKTLIEVEEAGYESSGAQSGDNDEMFYLVTSGLFEYALLLNETAAEYQEHDDNGYIGDLTVKSASFNGLSRNAAELRYHADGTVDTKDDPWAIFNSLTEKIIDASNSGKDIETIIEELSEEMPEYADEIRTAAELISLLSSQIAEAESGEAEESETE